MNLFVAITTYENKVYEKCALSLLQNCTNLMQSGHKVATFFNSELYIDLSRNKCVDEFLKTNADEILFVDADLAFEGEAMQKILRHDKPIVAGAYRLKYPLENYPVVIDWDNHKNCKDEESGLVWVKSAPTGFMKIKRHVFEDMIKHYDMKPCNRDIYHFFETGTKVFNDGKWWGEDTSFCWKWRNMGGEVFVEPRIHFTHLGNVEFKGVFHDYLMKGSLKNQDKSDDGINGWMDETDMNVLKALAKKCDDIVEVGCWKGRSTKELLNICKKVYAVDNFMGNEFDAAKLAKVFGSDPYEDFMKNVGSHPNLELLKGNSVDMAQSFDGKKVDMVFIDAGHEYEDIKSDIEAWLPKCKKIIAGHDYAFQFPGVIRAVQEFGDTHDVKVKGTIWWCEL